MTRERPYTDLFVDFDDTLCDTHGNAQLALREVFSDFRLEHYFYDPDVFFTAYWEANIDLWRRYGRGEISQPFLIVERFRRPLSRGHGLDVTEQLCLQMSDRFLDHCAEKPARIDTMKRIDTNVVLTTEKNFFTPCLLSIHKCNTTMCNLSELMHSFF